MEDIKKESGRLLKEITPIIDQIAMLHLRHENVCMGKTPISRNNAISREDEFYQLAFYYQSILSEVLGLSVEDVVVVPKRILDLLVREVNYAWWSEGCLFNLTQAESDEVEKFMAAYNKDGHLNLIINYE
jgi:hypothetical protein